MLKGSDADAQWISIAPQAIQETLSKGPMVWSRNVPAGDIWIDFVPSVQNSLSLNEWHNVTVTANGRSASIYVDKVKVGEGNIADIVDGTTRVFVGVNNWDTPLYGAVDNLRIYNETLTAAQVALQ